MRASTIACIIYWSIASIGIGLCAIAGNAATNPLTFELDVMVKGVSLDDLVQSTLLVNNGRADPISVNWEAVKVTTDARGTHVSGTILVDAAEVPPTATNVYLGFDLNHSGIMDANEPRFRPRHVIPQIPGGGSGGTSRGAGTAFVRTPTDRHQRTRHPAD